MIFDFLEFTLDPTAGSLHGPRGEIRLRPKTLALLEILVAEAPAVLLKDELMDRVWGQEHLGETSLAQAVSELRRALGDDPRQPRIIETRHRRGYRFIAPLGRRPESDVGGAAVHSAEGREPRRRNGPPPVSLPSRRLLPGTRPSLPQRWPVLLLAFALGGLLLLARDSVGIPEAGPRRPPPVTVERLAILPFTFEGSASAKAAGEAHRWLEVGLPILVGTKLQKHPKIYVYPMPRAEAMLGDLPDLHRGGGKALSAAGRYLDADWVLRGRLRDGDGPGVTASLELYSVPGARRVWAREDVFTAPDAALQSLRWAAAVERRVDPGAPPRRIRRNRYGPSLAVFERFFNAYRLAASEPRQALGLLEEAAALAPHHALITAARARVLVQHDHLAEARALAREGRASSKDRRLDVWFLSVLGQSEGALRLLHTLPPKIGLDPELWLESLRAFDKAHQPATVLTWLDSMPEQVRRSWLEAEFDLLEADVAEELGDPARARAARDRAVATARRRGQYDAVARGAERLARF